MVAVPSNQSRVISVRKEAFQSRRLNMVIAEHHIGSSLMTGFCGPRASPSTGIVIIFMTPKKGVSTNYLVPLSVKSVANCYHFAWFSNCRLGDWWLNL